MDNNSLFDRSDFLSIEYGLEELDKAGKFRVNFPADADFLTRKERMEWRKKSFKIQLMGMGDESTNLIHLVWVELDPEGRDPNSENSHSDYLNLYRTKMVPFLDKFFKSRKLKKIDAFFNNSRFSLNTSCWAKNTYNPKDFDDAEDIWEYSYPKEGNFTKIYGWSSDPERRKRDRNLSF